MTTQKARQMPDSPAANGHLHIDDLLDSGLQMVEDVMFNVVDSDVSILRDASRHILRAGGKRIRPRLLLLSYAAAGGRQLEDAARIAAAVELVHTASVVHDDINDHGMVRRGLPSINAIWGRTFALLTGDFLFTKVYELMAPYKDMNVELAVATVALVEGETLQASAVKESNFTREVYMQIIALKTAALFKSAARLGGMLGNASQNEIDALGAFGFNIGMAFQVIDDILDLIADEDQLGKTAGLDLAQGKGFASIYGGNGTSTVGGAAIAEVDADDPLTAIRSKALEGDTIEKGRIEAQHLAELAISYLDVLPASAAKDALIATARGAVYRDF